MRRPAPRSQPLPLVSTFTYVGLGALILAMLALIVAGAAHSQQGEIVGVAFQGERSHVDEEVEGM